MKRQTFIIGEVGINANGSVDIAKELIDGAIFAGAEAVKFQKRDIETVYTNEELDSPRESPFGYTFRDQKIGLEFSPRDYQVINDYCKMRGITWFASAWDLESLLFLRQFNNSLNKVASAMLGNLDFIKEVAAEGKYTFISTGMSTIEEIDSVVRIFKSSNCPFELMHTTSTYPMKTEEANLSLIAFLRDRYKCKVGYSNHSTGIALSCAAVALGATSIEAHITLDRSMYGSDQAASIEIEGFRRLVKYIRAIETAIGEPVKEILESEKPIREKLRWYDKC